MGGGYTTCGNVELGSTRYTARKPSFGLLRNDSFPVGCDTEIDPAINSQILNTSLGFSELRSQFQQAQQSQFKQSQQSQFKHAQQSQFRQAQHAHIPNLSAGQIQSNGYSREPNPPEYSHELPVAYSHSLPQHMSESVPQLPGNDGTSYGPPEGVTGVSWPMDNVRYWNQALHSMSRLPTPPHQFTDKSLSTASSLKFSGQSIPLSNLTQFYGSVPSLTTANLHLQPDYGETIMAGLSAKSQEKNMRHSSPYMYRMPGSGLGYFQTPSGIRQCGFLPQSAMRVQQLRDQMSPTVKLGIADQSPVSSSVPFSPGYSQQTLGSPLNLSSQPMQVQRKILENAIAAQLLQYSLMVASEQSSRLPQYHSLLQRYALANNNIARGQAPSPFRFGSQPTDKAFWGLHTSAVRFPRYVTIFLMLFSG